MNETPVRKEIRERLENDSFINNHLKKFEGDSLFMLVNRYLDHYYQRYQDEGGKLTKDQFRRQIFIPDIKEYYYLFRTDDQGKDRETKLARIKRAGYLGLYYEKMIYEGEDIPLVNAERNLIDRFSERNFHKEAETFWAVSASQYNLAQTLEVN